MFIDDFAAEVAFHHVVAVDHFADRQHFGVGKLVHPLGVRNLHLVAISTALTGPMPWI